jgi:hypothetical protein
VYQHFDGQFGLAIPSIILGGIAFVVTIPIYVFYYKGPAIRERSRFAQTIASDRKVVKDRRALRARESKSGDGDRSMGG